MVANFKFNYLLLNLRIFTESAFEDAFLKFINFTSHSLAYKNHKPRCRIKLSKNKKVRSDPWWWCFTFRCKLDRRHPRGTPSWCSGTDTWCRTSCSGRSSARLSEASLLPLRRPPVARTRKHLKYFQKSKLVTISG